MTHNEDGWLQGLADYVWYGKEKLEFYENAPADWVTSYRAAQSKVAADSKGEGKTSVG